MQVLQNQHKNTAMLFKHHISFKQIDPLGDGLREEIVQEQSEPNVITLEESVDEDQLDRYWHAVEDDIEHDPEWFHFTEDN
jgi:hypothetical protein